MTSFKHEVIKHALTNYFPTARHSTNANQERAHGVDAGKLAKYWANEDKKWMLLGADAPLIAYEERPVRTVPSSSKKKAGKAGKASQAKKAKKN